LVHGLPAWAGPNQADAFVVLADSFDGYLASLYPCDDAAHPD
jgi:hypothetical protein